MMKALYRFAALLLMLFAILHTLAFQQDVPEWHAGPVTALMRSVHFNALGFNRTYWDFFVGFGLFFSVFLLHAAVAAWQLSVVPADAWTRLTRQMASSLSVAFVVVAALSWRYAFAIPIAFSTAIAVCLVAATWFAMNRSATVASGPE